MRSLTVARRMTYESGPEKPAFLAAKETPTKDAMVDKIPARVQLSAAVRMSAPSPRPDDDASRISRDWEEMLRGFRALGGVAENVVPGRGSFGRGLFPRDPTKAFALKLPNNLLFPVSDIEFVEGRIRIKSSVGVGAAERDFFERYQSMWSWGGGGESESARFITMLDSLPPEVRAILIKNFAMSDLLEGDPAKRTRGQFLRSRMIGWNGRSVLMPLIELANCGTDGVLYRADSEGRLLIEGESHGEILVNYGPYDSFNIFHGFGFATARPRANSLPLTTKIGTVDLAIDWLAAAKTERANISMPKMRFEHGKIFLSHLMIGNTKSPRLCRGIFYTLMREAGATGADEAFDRILSANKLAFLGLLEALEPHRGEMVSTLRKLAHLQLESMAHCVGSRDL